MTLDIEDDDVRDERYELILNVGGVIDVQLSNARTVKDSLNVGGVDAELLPGGVSPKVAQTNRLLDLRIREGI